MRTTSGVAALLIALLPASTAAQDAKTVIADASRALGAEGLNSITYSGSAAQGNFGQKPKHLFPPCVDINQKLHAHNRLRPADVSGHRRGIAAGE
jgi:hypothetical protein